MKEVFVVGINGSPFDKGTVSKLLKKFLASAKKAGAKTELINLGGKDIKHCLGCYSINPKNCKYPCVVKDDMQKIYPILEKADVIVLGSPVYWFNMSGIMKNFIDRLCSTAAGGYKLEGKIGVFFASTKENEGGKMTASTAMATAMNHLGLIIPPYGTLFYPAKEKIFFNGKCIWDDWVLNDIPYIAKNCVDLSKFLRKSKYI